MSDCHQEAAVGVEETADSCCTEPARTDYFFFA